MFFTSGRDDALHGAVRTYSDDEYGIMMTERVVLDGSFTLSAWVRPVSVGQDYTHLFGQHDRFAVGGSSRRISLHDLRDEFGPGESNSLFEASMGIEWQAAARFTLISLVVDGASARLRACASACLRVSMSTARRWDLQPCPLPPVPDVNSCSGIQTTVKPTALVRRPMSSGSTRSGPSLTTFTTTAGRSAPTRSGRSTSTRGCGRGACSTLAEVPYKGTCSGRPSTPSSCPYQRLVVGSVSEAARLCGAAPSMRRSSALRRAASLSCAGEQLIGPTTLQAALVAFTLVDLL